MRPSQVYALPALRVRRYIRRMRPTGGLRGRRGHQRQVRRETLFFREDSHMQVSQILTREVETIRPDMPVREAAQRMRSMDVGSLPVCDGRHLLGMVTDRDITIRITAEGRDPANTPVQEAMTPDVAFVFEDQDVQEAARIMQERQIRRLPVLSRDKQLVGIVALGDVAQTGQDRLAGDALEKISEPSQGRANA
jgi:CBS domain-containing protein